MPPPKLPFEQWTEVLGSERLTGALLDRLTHRVHILEVNGPSHRLQDAKARLKRRLASPPGAGASHPRRLCVAPAPSRRPRSPLPELDHDQPFKHASRMVHHSDRHPPHFQTALHTRTCTGRWPSSPCPT